MEPTIVIDAGHGGYQLRKNRKGKSTVSELIKGIHEI